MSVTSDTITQIAEQARAASQVLLDVPTDKKNEALDAMARLLEEEQDFLKAENTKDLDKATRDDLSGAMIDRLTLDEKTIATIAAGLRKVRALPDPVGQILKETIRPNGLAIEKLRVPIGVIAIIFESRPNVTVDAAALCLKSGNATILRGGKEALHSNIALAKLFCRALEEAGLPAHAVQLIETTDREAINVLLQLNDCIDLVIPRGGEGLIRTVVHNSTIPVIKHYAGVCHVYVDEFADLAQAVAITVNAKVQRPGVCNAAETLLVHERVAKEFLPKAAGELIAAGVELRGCEKTLAILGDSVTLADEGDWATEYLDLILSVKVVADVDEAIQHIAKYGSAHSDAIVSDDPGAQKRFVDKVDSSAVFVNASTRFNDGFEFGLGAEIGISTDKLHARGPMGLEELTSYKYIVCGEGHVRT